MENKNQDILIAEIRTDLKYIKDFIANAKDNFASKWTEKVVAGMVGLAMIAVGSAIIAGVVKAAEFIINITL